MHENDLDFRRGFVTIRRNLIYNHYERIWCEKETKEGDVRVLPLLPSVRCSMKEMLSERVPTISDRYLFLNQAGQPYKWGRLNRIFKRALRKAGLRDMRLMDATRHSVASQARALGARDLDIAEMLGHRTLQSTKRYAHAPIDRLTQFYSTVYGKSQNEG